MNKQRAITGLASLAVIALVAAVVAIGLNVGARAPRSASLSWPTYAQSVPSGCRPVAPGAYTTICDGGNVAITVSRGSPGVDCHPVAPGAFSQICATGDVGSGPTQPAPDKPSGIECKPVAPGAFSEVCTRP